MLHVALNVIRLEIVDLHPETFFKKRLQSRVVLVFLTYLRPFHFNISGVFRGYKIGSLARKWVNTIFNKFINNINNFIVFINNIGHEQRCFLQMYQITIFDF